MKSGSVKGRPAVGSWDSPESHSGAANSQIRGEYGWPLPDLVSRAAHHSSRGGKPIGPLQGGPRGRRA